MKQYKTLLLFAFLTTSFITIAQTEQVDLNQLIKETQITNSQNGDIQIIWWIPTEFWETALGQDLSLPEVQKKEFIDALSLYTFFAIVDGKLGTFGKVTYQSREAILENLTLKGNNNQIVKTLDESTLGVEVQMLLATFKPMLKNMMGNLGENMHFFVFPDKNESGDRVANPKIPGQVAMDVLKKTYTWDTPIGALMPAKICPKDKKEMTGAWKYCPFHGTELVAKE